MTYRGPMRLTPEARRKGETKAFEKRRVKSDRRNALAKAARKKNR